MEDAALGRRRPPDRDAARRRASSTRSGRSLEFYTAQAQGGADRARARGGRGIEARRVPRAAASAHPGAGRARSRVRAREVRARALRGGRSPRPSRSSPSRSASRSPGGRTCEPGQPPSPGDPAAAGPAPPHHDDRGARRRGDPRADPALLLPADHAAESGVEDDIAAQEADERRSCRRQIAGLQKFATLQATAQAKREPARLRLRERDLVLGRADGHVAGDPVRRLPGHVRDRDDDARPGVGRRHGADDDRVADLRSARSTTGGKGLTVETLAHVADAARVGEGLGQPVDATPSTKETDSERVHASRRASI